MQDEGKTSGIDGSYSLWSEKQDHVQKKTREEAQKNHVATLWLWISQSALPKLLLFTGKEIGGSSAYQIEQNGSLISKEDIFFILM